ncbi:hypothetical protein ACO22_05597 [Paracoccidioides brasiliensis]|uniref:CHL4 family chromosome segregation protein n=1 Tax=Paracoccidioides brasiliensis TaxID=121759 RepID=A0A1D2J9T0_PARBR|nr:hypothetical protein ACO22_05597 [Paracoccidioides brasiliensis]
MARHAVVRAPTAASLHDSLLIPSTTLSLVKTLGRLSRSSLLDLVLQWLHDKNVKSFPPYLGPHSVANFQVHEEEFNTYPPANSVEELRGIYEDLRDRKGGKREVIDRILEGDWRHGISLRQLAMVDMQYIEDHPVGQRWTALQLVPLNAESPQSIPGGDISKSLPRFHASIFLRSIQREISPLVKAHYHLYRSKTLPLTFVRIFVIDSPYQRPRQSPYVFTDSSRIIYLAFPDSTPYIYSSHLSYSSLADTKTTSATLSNTLTTDTRTLRRFVKDAIPNALSRPQQRYNLKPTSLTSKSLHTLLSLRGPGRTNAANGAFTVFADAVVEGCPLDPRLPQSLAPGNYDSVQGYAESRKENIPFPQLGKLDNTHTPSVKKKTPFQESSTTDPEAEQIAKKRKLAVNSRFGTAGNQQMTILPFPPITSPTSPPKPNSEPQIPTSVPVPVPALDRLEIHLQDPPVPSNSHDEDDEGDDEEDGGIEDKPSTLSLTFSGSNVIAGLRQLAELHVVDPARMPSWMTGEEAVSVAVVKAGRRCRSREAG